MNGPGFEAVLVSLAGEVDAERSGGIGDPLDPGRVTRYTEPDTHLRCPAGRESRQTPNLTEL